MKKQITKSQLADWYVKEYSDCGRVHYFGTPQTHEPMSEADFHKWLMKKSQNELVNMINNHSDEGQEFLKQNGLADD